MRKRNYLIFLSFIPLFMISCISVEEADYKVTKKDGEYELRRYTKHILAETSVDASLEEAGNIAFRRLFGYISGQNSSQEEIAMTAPVGQTKGEDGWLVSFMMPMSYTMDTLPIPNDPQVKLRLVPAQNIASISYSGSWSEEGYLKNLQKLKEWTQKQGLNTIDKPIWARYNPPFTLWFLRRNEILLPLDSKKKSDK